MSKAGWMLAIALMTAAGAVQAQDLRWQVRQSAEGAVLAYEQPDTDFQPIFLGCLLPQRRFTVSLEGRRGVAPGRTVPVEFASEAGRVTLRLRAEITEIGDILTAHLPYDPALGQVIGEGRTLRVTVAGRAETFPLAGTKAGVAALAAACGPR
ncbi:hypothetical protein [Neoroseomonas oryzicola]|uniref:Invasion associated locus B family protein n=1 Tax=Neoroseomonas oryzicola TaxID=535904 RepID=A0A9X9WH37_9PROT|nr:hypothetical protein [Neoroseomonas oryzicola]MBR0659647.1 hypothetical protein [Neoroseomonas oryzicola]NKE15492.1 hypothetical protein [Neoroseomonas oryzicola]